MMKRVITSLLAAVILLTGLTVPAFATETENTDDQKCCACFVDADSDGVCDHRHQSNGKGFAFGRGKRPNFVDANGDGICDHRRLRNGRGWAFGLLRQVIAGKPCPCSRGNGPFRGQQNDCPETPFLDEDGDGICDMPGQSNGKGQGLGNGKGWKRGQNK